jgi:hypothetical protein
MISMTETDEADNDNAPEGESARLEQALVEAHYLGLSLRTLGANRDFRYGPITTSIGELLIGWARFVGGRLHNGERLFANAPTRRGRKRNK